MSVRDIDSVTCDYCDGYNISPVICVDCLKRWIRDAKEKNADYVGEYLINKLDALDSNHVV